MNAPDLTKSSEFLIKETKSENIFIPEESSEEQKMMVQAIEDFLEKEVYPNVEKIDKAEPGLVQSLLKKAGDLGFLAVDIDEKYNGLGMDLITSLLVVDNISTNGSFSTAFGAHTGIGTLPIYYYGNEEQKAKYLPKLTSGEWAASYCLTEPNAGSDANSGKTSAKLSDDKKHYIINGQKIWISNAGFADLMIVFAKIDDDKNLTGFIVERAWDGITMGEEEHKMGIKGSSTKQVFFNNLKVPVENMLSEREHGFKIAVNILNVGRIKLGFACITSMKRVITLSTSYANDRKQFNVPISSFGAIKQKLANMVMKCYAVESMSYRAGMDIQRTIDEKKSEGLEKSKTKLKAFEQYAVECAIIKIFSSEALAYCTDEGVQIYGGMGFSEDAPMARAYRDARITRIYEGTNEINRMLLVGMIIKKAMKGEVDLFNAAIEIGKELTSIPSFNQPDHSEPLSYESHLLINMKKSILMVAGKAIEIFRDNFSKEQEIMLNIANMIMGVYAAESCILRTKKILALNKYPNKENLFLNLARLSVNEALITVKNNGEEAINSFADGDLSTVLHMGLKRFTKANPINTKEIRTQIADITISENKFPYSVYK